MAPLFDQLKVQELENNSQKYLEANGKSHIKKMECVLAKKKELRGIAVHKAFTQNPR